MTKRHFVAIAAVIRAELNAYGASFAACEAIESTAHNLCTVLADFNPAFDRARFLAACGVEDI